MLVIWWILSLKEVEYNIIMNEYTYDEITIGLIEEFCILLDDEKMDAFMSITGDTNPLHTDEVYAKEHLGYSGKVAYGLLTASFLSTLAGMYLPGKHSLLHSVEVKFAKPVLPPDTLTIRGEVVDKEDRFRLLKVKANIYNSIGENVCRASIKVGVIDESH